MKDCNKGPSFTAAGKFIFGTGIVFLLLFLFYQKSLILSLDPNPNLFEITVEKIKLTRLYLLSISLILIFISGAAKVSPDFNHYLNRIMAIKLVRYLLLIVLPIVIFELYFHPLALQKPTILMRDDDLIWKLRPNSESIWAEAIVKINSKGLRGPELDYLKPADTKRILYLGDSITFGFSLKSYDQTFPCQVQEILEEGNNKRIETINAGVGGYSPWQEYIYLSKEGISYDPDLVVVAFTLTDVSEKLGLRRFGGDSEGAQLAASATTIFDWLSNKSRILYFIKEAVINLRFSGNIEKMVPVEEGLKINQLIDEANDPDIKEAWDVTLNNLGKIFDFCKSRNIPVMLVIFPVASQFDDVENMSGPQIFVGRFASKKNVLSLDLLPLLSQRVKNQKGDLKDYFLDSLHLSAEGNKVVAELIADFIKENNILYF